MPRSQSATDPYGESEGERFFASLASLVRTPARRPFIGGRIGVTPKWVPLRSSRRLPLKRLALGAGRQAVLRGGRALRRPGATPAADPPLAPDDPGYDPYQDPTFGSALGPQYNPYTSSYEPAGSPVPDLPDSWKASAGIEPEPEQEARKVRMLPPASLMEHLARAAAKTRRQSEALALIGAIVPLTASMLPRAAPAISRAAPGLVCGLAGIVRTLHPNPTTRPLLRALPAIMRRTAASLARKASQGLSVSPQAAVRILARHTVRVLGSRATLVRTFRRSQRLDRHFRAGAA